MASKLNEILGRELYDLYDSLEMINRADRKVSKEVVTLMSQFFRDLQHPL